jgi:hypothetical protein
MNTSHPYKAVCYRCSYEAVGADDQRCPVCAFPVILEADSTPPGGRRLEEILKRAQVRAGTAPLLPGVDAAKRKAQLLAESRKRRRTAEPVPARSAAAVAAPAAAVTVASAPGGTAAVLAGSTRWLARVGFAVLCASAVAVGALAAVIQHGGL